MMNHNQNAGTEATSRKGSKDKQNGGISFQTFGENTSIPLDIKKAVFHISDPAPFLHRVMMGVELTVVNNAVQKDVSGKLRILLPQGATVKKFEFLRTESDGSSRWYPATAVPKKQAKEVVYKEKEKGRDVAAVSDVASGSNVFEMEVSPLPYQKEVQCRLESLVEGCLDDVKDFVATCFSPGEQTEVVVTVADNPNFERSDERPLNDSGGATIGDCFGKTHFVCRVPGSNPKGSSSTNRDRPAQKIERIAIVWDTSASMSKTKDLVEERCDRLKELAMLCNKGLVGNSEAKSCTSVTFELFTFGTAVEKKGVFNSAEAFIKAISEIDYDGGTDITHLSALFCDLAARSSDDKIDSVLVFTDGMDNLGRVPNFSASIDSYSIGFPVHCIADGNEVNLKCLRHISAASPLRAGKVFTGKDESYVDGVLYPQALLKSIRTDQADDAFMEEVDDGFICIPDHRLQILNEPIPSNGLLISGVLGDKQKGPSTVSKICAEVLYGNEVHQFRFQLRPNSTNEKDKPTLFDAAGGITRHFHVAIDLSATEKTELSINEPASILGHLYAEETYRAAEKFGLKSGMDIKAVSEELSIQYGFCSPESSLLMLYSIDQFLDNSILPPIGHPAYDHRKAVEERKKRSEEKQNYEKTKSKDIGTREEIKEGDIGGLKTEEQMKKVLQLSQKLEEYFASPLPNKAKKSKDARSLKMRSVHRFMSRFVQREFAPEEARSLEVGVETTCNSRSVRRSSFSEGFECRSGIISDMALYFEDEDGDDSEFVLCEEDALGHERAPNSSAGSSRQLNQPSISQPKDPEAYATKLETALKQGDGKDWKQEYTAQRAELSGPKMTVPPSFFLTCARLVLQYATSLDAIRIATNCLELSIEDVQMLRCVGYFLLSVGEEFAVNMAIDVFDKVQELQPCEPQSYLDGALARFWKTHKFALRCDSRSKIDEAEKCGIFRLNLTKCQELLSHVLTHQWADRFAEVEWPALILLHCVADLVKEHNDSMKLKDSEPSFLLPEWPTSDLSPFQSCTDVGQEGLLRCSAFDLVLMVWLGWDTDKTDIDLHVKEPSGNEVYYGNRDSNIGGHLSRDFTAGYGPEVYMLKDSVDIKSKKAGRVAGILAGQTKQHKDMVGKYHIYAKYFASHQDSTLTGATSAVLWTLEKAKGSKTKKVIEFHSIRLDTHKEKTEVGTVCVAAK